MRPAEAFIGYAARGDREASPKAATLLWETQGNSAGTIAWTGSYWAVETWVEGSSAPNVVALRRRAAKAKLSGLPYVGHDAIGAALERWASHPSLVLRSEPQAAYLARLGLANSEGMPKAMATIAISVLRQASAAERGLCGWMFDPDLERARPLRNTVVSESWTGRMAELCQVLYTLSDAVFRPSPDRLSRYARSNATGADSDGAPSPSAP